MSEIEERLQRLERRNRWLTTAIVALTASVLMAAACGSEGRVANQIRARQFIVVGEEGDDLATFGEDMIRGEAHLTLSAQSDMPDGEWWERMAFLTPSFLSFHDTWLTELEDGEAAVRSSNIARYAASGWLVQDSLKNMLVEASVHEVSGVPAPYVRAEHGVRAGWLLGRAEIKLFDDQELVWLAPTKP